MSKQPLIIAAASIITATAQTSNARLPDPGLVIDRERTAIVIADPQNDFLSPEGVTWGVVGKSVETNNTVENIGR
jgi:hypothetical protein